MASLLLAHQQLPAVEGYGLSAGYAHEVGSFLAGLGGTQDAGGGHSSAGLELVGQLGGGDFAVRALAARYRAQW